jgi:hypothetical protein
MAFGEIVDEVIAQFTSRPGASVTIKIEIQAEDAKGFDENLQRAIRENCNMLRIEPAEFEGE